MSDTLADSYKHCCQIARRTAKNFYYSFTGLPPHQFRAMCALYAYMRICDDIGDDESRTVEQRRTDLSHWEDAVQDCLLSGAPTSALDSMPSVLPAVADVVARFHVPHAYFFEVIAGMRMDLESNSSPNGVLSCRYQTFEELQRYCYHVAGVVGLCCIHIWGIRDPRAIELAIDCGLAMQLTNILRDVATDADVGRVYLPAEDFVRFGYSPEQLRDRVRNDAFLQLMAFEAARARDCYSRSEALASLIEPIGRPILWAMREIYGGVLKEIERRDFEVFSQRVSLPVSRKLWVALQAYVKHALTAQHVALVRLIPLAQRIPIGWVIAVLVVLGAISGWKESVVLDVLCRRYGTPVEKAATMALIGFAGPIGIWLSSILNPNSPQSNGSTDFVRELRLLTRQFGIWIWGVLRFPICGIEIGVLARSVWDREWYLWPLGFWLLVLASAQATYWIARRRMGD